MKNPIRAYIARIARQEILAERRERNIEAVKSEERHWRELAERVRAIREHNGRVIGQAFDHTELHGKIDHHPL